MSPARHGMGEPPRGPLPGESFDGYLAYRAARAHMPGPFELAALGGAHLAHYPQLAFGEADEDGLPAVAEALDIDPEELRIRSHVRTSPLRRRFHNTTIDLRLIERRTRRFSPASLVQSPHHRALWSLRCLTFCEETWETLADACPTPYCEAVQRWRHSSGVDLCDKCGGSLKEVEVRMVPRDDRPALRFLCGFVHHDPVRNVESARALPEALAGMPGGGILEIACAVAGLHDPELRKWSVRSIRWNDDPLRVAAAMAVAGGMLLEWPRSGERLAAERLATRRGKFGDGNEGATTDFLGLGEASQPDGPVKIAAGLLADALRANAGLGKPIKESVIGTGLTVTAMAALRRAGRVETVFHLTGDRIVPLIATKSLRRLREERGDGIPILNAATRLGITCNGVEQLLLSGTLDPAGAADGPPFSRLTRIDAGSLDRFYSRLSQAAGARPNHSWITLVEASRRMGGDLKPWGVWLDRIADGSIAAAILPGSDAIVERMMVSVHAAEIMSSTRVDVACMGGSFSPSMSKLDAVATLNLHTRHMKDAFKSWPTPADRRPCIPLEEVRRLAALCIASSELAALLGTSSIKAARAARSLGLQSTAHGFGRAEALIAFNL